MTCYVHYLQILDSLSKEAIVIHFCICAVSVTEASVTNWGQNIQLPSWKQGSHLLQPCIFNILLSGVCEVEITYTHICNCTSPVQFYNQESLIAKTSTEQQKHCVDNNVTIIWVMTLRVTSLLSKTAIMCRSCPKLSWISRDSRSSRVDLGCESWGQFGTTATLYGNPERLSVAYRGTQIAHWRTYTSSFVEQ